MALLAELEAGHIVVDPQCGSGTICIEAKAREPDAIVIGSDLVPEALAVTQTHAAAARADLAGTVLAAAAQLPLRDASVDRVLCNPAWGNAVKSHGKLISVPELFWKEISRLLTDQAKALVLLDEARPEVINACGFHQVDRLRLRISGRWTTLHTLMLG